MNKLVACVGAALALVGSAHAERLIAIAAPLTGENAAWGGQIRQGAEMAVADLNAKGGVLGEKVKLEIADDACDPKLAVQVAHQLVAKKIGFVYGHWCSGATIPASVVYNDAKILNVTTSSNPLVTERGLKNIFRIFGRDDQQGVVAGTFITRRFKDRKIAVVDDRSTYGKGLADVMAATLEAAKQKPVLRESVTVGEKDYSPLIGKMKAAGVEAMAYGGYHGEVVTILKQAHQAGLKLMVVGGDALANTDLVRDAGALTDNVMFTFPPDHRKNPANANVVRKFREAKIEPEGYVLYAYAAINLYAQAAEKAKSVAFADLQKTLASGTFDTVIGKLTFDAKGDNQSPGFVVYQWKGKQYDNVK
jgi:branched-chain amino acid transport system substrate-binding protein